MSGSAGATGGGGSAYVAVNCVIVNIAGCLGGLAAGLIAQELQAWSWVPFAGAKAMSFYDVLFALSGVLRLAAVAIFLPFIHEPTARSSVEALRFITVAVRCTSVTIVAQPVRLILRRFDQQVRAEA